MFDQIKIIVRTSRKKISKKLLSDLAQNRKLNFSISYLGVQTVPYSRKGRCWVKAADVRSKVADVEATDVVSKRLMLGSKWPMFELKQPMFQGCFRE